MIISGDMGFASYTLIPVGWSGGVGSHCRTLHTPSLPRSSKHLPSAGLRSDAINTRNSFLAASLEVEVSGFGRVEDWASSLFGFDPPLSPGNWAFGKDMVNSFSVLREGFKCVYHYF